ncbi:MAG: alpha/beta hydrolase [Planctomycetes bacterium]|nr:alpha/beta hydrolase [Planctomycetota bacterium]
MRSSQAARSAVVLAAIAIARALVPGFVAEAAEQPVGGRIAPMLSEAGEDASPARPRLHRPDLGDLGARIEFYTSKLDGEKRPYGFCEIGEPGELKALLVLLMPGADSSPNPVALLRNIEEAAARVQALGESCILIRPSGRGPGSVYVNYGEVDALEAIEDACRRFPVDRDRIGLFGFSMGGAATWYLEP